MFTYAHSIKILSFVKISYSTVCLFVMYTQVSCCLYQIIHSSIVIVWGQKAFSIVKLPVIADVSNRAVEVAEEFALELVPPLVASQVVSHHLLQARRVGKVGH